MTEIEDQDHKSLGFEEPVHGLDAYPLDSVLIRTEQRSIIDVLRRIGRDAVKLDPEFQRAFVWSEERQSRLIESILMRIPLPVFYFAEQREGSLLSLVVVDGLQRLSTMKRFHENKLKLKLQSDEINSEINGANFDELPQRLKDRFEDGQITLYLIDHRLPDRVRLDIFERVNSGVPLTRQQMRNALYSGAATRLLKELAEADVFVEATHKSLSKEVYQKDMLDRQGINRFLAFHVLGWRRVAKEPWDFEDRLGQALQKLNAESDEVRASAREAFLASMRANLAVFGDYAFRKHAATDERKKPFNINLFDVFSVMFARWPEESIKTRSAAIQKGFFQLIGRDDFLRSLSAATTSPESVAMRFDLTEQMLKEVLGDP
jgi:Protein of unknown function DUF262